MLKESRTAPGPVVLFGSGETSPSGQKVFASLFQQLPSNPRVAVLETPAGFELNSAQVAGRLAGFLREHLQNFHPQVEVISARRRSGRYSTQDPQVIAPLWDADLVFLGPGSPTYAVRHLEGTLAWQVLQARQRCGAAVVLASAAAIAASAYALPVYEIYKVGEDLHWVKGLDFFAAYGLELVLVPHWNNREGGADLDTRFCFMGKPRFELLLEQLPSTAVVVGVDELTALMLELQSGTGEVFGQGGVTILQDGAKQCFSSGEMFSLAELGGFSMATGGEGIPAAIWQQALQLQANTGAKLAVPPDVRALVQEREAARARKDWAVADRLRGSVAALGWQVRDTPDGPEVERG